MQILAELIDNSRVCSEKHDSRTVIWLSVLTELARRGHIIHAMNKRGIEISKHPFIKYDPSINPKIDFYIGHCVYFRSKDRYDYFSKKGVPLVTYEAGWLYQSLLVDRIKFFKDSYYYNNIKDVIEHKFNRDEVENYRKQLIAKGISKWPQSNTSPIPDFKYIFLPGQVLHDLSIVRYCKVGMKHFISRVTNFAKKHQLQVIYKPHPGAAKSEVSHGKIELEKFVKEFKNDHTNFHVISTSIYDLMRKAEFTACINAGTMVDNFVTQTPVYACGQSIFSNSGGIVCDENIEQGLLRMLNKEYDLGAMKLQQLKLLWWLRTTMMQEEYSAVENIRRLEYHTGIKFD